MVIIRKKAGCVHVENGITTVYTGNEIILTLDSESLVGADLRGADLTSADLAGADLRFADLSGAKLLCTDFTGANLMNAKIMGTHCVGCYITGANLRGARLAHSMFIWAKLHGTDLTGCDLNRTKLLWCRFDATTVWPVDFDPSERHAGPSAARLSREERQRQAEITAGKLPDPTAGQPATAEEFALLTAAASGDLNALARCIENGVPVDFGCSGPLGTPLMRAASYGRLDIAAKLIELGADVNAVDSNGRTALLWAIISEQPHIVEFLINSGANIGAPARNGELATQHARATAALLKDRYDRAIQSVELISSAVKMQGSNNKDCPVQITTCIPTTALDRKARLMADRLQQVSAKGDVQSIMRYVKGGLPIDSGAGLEVGTALARAAAFGRLDAAAKLIELSADVNAADSFGRTPLIWAIELLMPEMVSLLLEHGADTREAAHDGMSPMDQAVRIAVHYGDRYERASIVVGLLC